MGVFWISIAVSVVLLMSMAWAGHQVLVTIRLYRRIPLADGFRTLYYTLRSRNGWMVLLPIVTVLVFCLALPLRDVSYPRIVLLPVALFHLNVLALYGTPPSILLLGSSRWESARLHNLIERGIYPYRVVALWESADIEPRRHSLFHWISFGVDNLRILGSHDWRDVVRRIARSVPIVVLDTRLASPAVVEETEQMILEPLRDKTLFVVADDGSAPSIAAARGQGPTVEYRTARLHEVVGTLKDMGLDRSKSPDDDFLLSRRSYERNSKKIERGMMAVARASMPFVTALDVTERRSGRTAFVTAARELQERLNGEPGDGALEVLAQLSGDIAATERFIAEWQHADGSQVQGVIARTRAVHRELCRLQEAVDHAPPVFLQRNEETLRRLRGGR